MTDTHEVGMCMLMGGFTWSVTCMIMGRLECACYWGFTWSGMYCLERLYLTGICMLMEGLHRVQCVYL